MPSTIRIPKLVTQISRSSNFKYWKIRSLPKIKSTESTTKMRGEGRGEKNLIQTLKKPSKNHPDPLSPKINSVSSFFFYSFFFPSLSQPSLPNNLVTYSSALSRTETISTIDDSIRFVKKEKRSNPSVGFNCELPPPSFFSAPTHHHHPQILISAGASFSKGNL